MSLFRFAKYSTLLFFLGKYKGKIFRVIAVLLFAAVTSLLYQDIAEYLHREHPGTVLYALAGKVIIVYGALAFVLWQFRPRRAGGDSGNRSAARPLDRQPAVEPPRDRLSRLENLAEYDRLRTRYDKVLGGGGPAENGGESEPPPG